MPKALNMLLQTTISSPPLHHHNQVSGFHSLLPFGSLKLRPHKQFLQHHSAAESTTSGPGDGLDMTRIPNLLIHQTGLTRGSYISASSKRSITKLLTVMGNARIKRAVLSASAFSLEHFSLWSSDHVAYAAQSTRTDALYEVGELFELGIQLSYLLLLLALLGVGTFFVIRQVLVRRELDLSAKELQEQVRSGDASATELFELGAVMLRRKVYPAATKYLLQAIEKWDGDNQDLAQVYNALGVSYVRDGKTDKGIAQFETAVKLQPGYVTAWNNLGDAYEKKKDMKAALRAFEEVLLFDPNNKVARPRRDALKDSAQLYKQVSVKSKSKDR